MFPNSLSPSRTSDYLQCPLLYRFRTIDKIPESPSIAAIRGNLVHSVLENIFDAPAGERTFGLARDLFDNALANLERESPDDVRALIGDPSHTGEIGVELVQELFAPISPVLSTYFTMEDPNRLEPFAREMAVSIEVEENFSIRGFIDRVDMTPTGEVRVVDYKSGKAPSDRYASKAMFQMRFYALAWWRMTERVPKLLQLMYLGNGKFLRYEPDEDDLLSTEKRILAIRAAIAESADALSFPPSPSKLCGWCSYKSLCPAFGGTPPPMPPRDEWTSGSTLVSDALGIVESNNSGSGRIPE